MSAISRRLSAPEVVQDSSSSSSVIANNETRRDKRRSTQGSDQGQGSPSPPPATHHRRRGSIQMLLRSNSRSSQINGPTTEEPSPLHIRSRDASISPPASTTSSRSPVSTSSRSADASRTPASQSRSNAPIAPRPPSQGAITSSHADRTPQRPHRPPPNSWLSRSSSKTLGRKRSGSLGASEDRNSATPVYESHSDSLSRTLSSSSAVSDSPFPNGSPNRPRSGTWSRPGMPPHRRGSSPLEPTMAGNASDPPAAIPAPSSPSLSSAGSGRKVRPSTMATPSYTYDLASATPAREPSTSLNSRRGSIPSLSVETAGTSNSFVADGKKSPGDRKTGKLLKKIRSRSLLPGQEVVNVATGGNGHKSSINASTDSLVSSSTRDSSTSSKERWASNALEKALPDWLTSKSKRRGDSFYPNGSNTSSTKTYTDKSSTESYRTLSARTIRPAKAVSEQSKADSEPEEMEILRNDTSVSVPGRLSSWILNVLGSESLPHGVVGDAKASDGGECETVGSCSRLDSDHEAATGSNIKGKAVNRKSSLPSIVTSTLPKATSKPSGLLASFSSSARARAAAAAGTVAATAGLDLTSEAQEAEIWLLGVRHGPRDPHVTLESASEKSLCHAPQDCGENACSETGSYRPGLQSDVQYQQPLKSVKASSESRDGPSPGDLSLSDLGSSLLSAVTSATASSISLAPGSVSSSSDWHARFQLDFSSRVWCSYRNYFPPIARDGTISEAAEKAAAISAAGTAASPAVRSSTPDGTVSMSRGNQNLFSSVNNKGWLSRRLAEAGASGDILAQAYSLGGALSLASPSQGSGSGSCPSPDTASSTMSLGEKMGITGIWGRATAAVQAVGLNSRAGLTTDAGWGCMLRTGQSLLANALIEVHLGREWRRSLGYTNPSSEHEKDDRLQRKVHASYVQILSWFMDDPSSACPFSIHRMAREGKSLGKEVGEWFGPSTAAGAIKRLVEEAPQAHLGVSLASDGVVYLSEVRAESKHPVGKTDQSSSAFWQRPVLVLIGLRLGLEGVNAMYHDAIKNIFSFAQSVGIAGGRPSSSYYFVGHQGDSLFYLDPHTVRPAVPFRHPPAGMKGVASSRSGEVGRQGRKDDEMEEWWSSAYADSELATFHCDRPKRMPMRSLDPSMLLGFLIKDEKSLQDFTTRVKELPKAIFAIQDELPRWMKGDDEDDLAGSEGEAAPSLESVSESSFMDDEEEETQFSKENGDDQSTVDISGERGGSSLVEQSSRSESGADGPAVVDEGYGSDETRPAGRGTMRLPEIRASSTAAKSTPAGPLHTVTEGLRQVFPLLRSSSYQEATDLTTDSGSDSPVDLETPRYQSDLRFPSSTSTATASGGESQQASIAGQARDQFVSVSRDEASEDNGAAASSLRSSAASIVDRSQPDTAEREEDIASTLGSSSIPLAARSRDVRPPLVPSASDNAFGTSWEEVSALASPPSTLFDDTGFPQSRERTAAPPSHDRSLEGQQEEQRHAQESSSEVAGSGSYIDLGRRRSGPSEAVASAPSLSRTPTLQTSSQEQLGRGRSGNEGQQGQKQKQGQGQQQLEGWSPSPTRFPVEEQPT